VTSPAHSSVPPLRFKAQKQDSPVRSLLSHPRVPLMQPNLNASYPILPPLLPQSWQPVLSLNIRRLVWLRHTTHTQQPRGLPLTQHVRGAKTNGYPLGSGFHHASLVPHNFSFFLSFFSFFGCMHVTLCIGTCGGFGTSGLSLLLAIDRMSGFQGQDLSSSPSSPRVTGSSAGGPEAKAEMRSRLPVPAKSGDHKHTQQARP
jgi:hypothetical protein